jgi:hypothetical protein
MRQNEKVEKSNIVCICYLAARYFVGFSGLWEEEDKNNLA